MDEDSVIHFPHREDCTASPSQLLSELLAKAQRGELEGVVVVALKTDGDIGCYATGTERRYALVGALAQMQFDLLNV